MKAKGKLRPGRASQQVFFEAWNGSLSRRGRRPETGIQVGIGFHENRLLEESERCNSLAESAIKYYGIFVDSYQTVGTHTELSVSVSRMGSPRRRWSKTMRARVGTKQAKQAMTCNEVAKTF